MTTYGYLAVEGWEHSEVNYGDSIKDLLAPDEDSFLTQSDVVRSGDYAMKFMPAADHGAAIASFSWSGESSGSVRAYFMFEELPTTGKVEVAFLNWNTAPTTLTTKIYYDPADGRLHMHQSTDQDTSPSDPTYDFILPLDYTSGSTVDGPPIAAGNWYLLELRWLDWFEERQTEWRVGGVDYPSIADVKDNQGAFENILFCWFGSATANACVLYVDDVVTTGNQTEDLPPATPELDPLYPAGPGYVLAYRPNACGTHNDPSNRLQEDDGSALDANTWNRLDDLPANPAGSWDGIKQVTVDAAAYAEFIFEDCREPWPITAFEFWQAFHLLSIGSARFFLKLEYDGTEYVQLGSASLWGHTTVSYRPGGLALDGYGGVAAIYQGPADLTKPKFNALAVRAGYSTDVTPVPALDGLLIQVAFSTENPTTGANAPDDTLLGTPTHVIASSGRTR